MRAADLNPMQILIPHFALVLADLTALLIPIFFSLVIYCLKLLICGWRYSFPYTTTKMEFQPISKTLDLIPASQLSKLNIPFVDIQVACGFTGFPSPADDWKQKALSLDDYLNLKENTTFYFRAKGESMLELGVTDGDILIVDTTLNPIEGKMCLCRLDGELIGKMVEKRRDGMYLLSANTKIKPFKLEGETELIVFGVVTHTIKKL